MSKKRKYRPKPVRAPMLVAWHNEGSLEISEFGAVLAFKLGNGNRSSHDVLVDCRDMLLLAASHKADTCEGAQKRDAEGVVGVCKAAGIALANIKDRHLRSGAITANEDELNTLSILVDTSKEFWKRQSGSLFEAAFNGLEIFRKYQVEQQAEKLAA